MISKTPGWEIRLMSKANALLGREFHWGVSDCVLVSLVLLDAMCETSWWLEGKDRWTTKAGAIRYRKKHGGFCDWLLGQGAVETERLAVGDFICGTVEGLENVGVLVDIENDVLLSASEIEGKIGLASLDTFDSYVAVHVPLNGIRKK